jgi:hypothetical protein
MGPLAGAALLPNPHRREPDATSRLSPLGRMAIPFLQSACLPLRREGVQTMRRVRQPGVLELSGISLVSL